MRKVKNRKFVRRPSMHGGRKSKKFVTKRVGTCRHPK